MDALEFWKTHQRCNKCGEVKPLDAFYAKPDNKSGYGKICKDCARAEAAARRALKVTNQRPTKHAQRDTRAPAKLGLLYIMTNPAFVGHYRVGVTSDPAGLLNEANSCDPHAKWEIIYQRSVTDIAMAELRILSSADLNTDERGWCRSPDKERVIASVRALVDSDADSRAVDITNNPFLDQGDMSA